MKRAAKKKPVAFSEFHYRRRVLKHGLTAVM